MHAQFQLSQVAVDKPVRFVSVSSDRNFFASLMSSAGRLLSWRLQ